MKLSLIGSCLVLTACGAGLSDAQKERVQTDFLDQTECVEKAKTREESDRCTDKVRAQRFQDGGL